MYDRYVTISYLFVISVYKYDNRCNYTFICIYNNNMRRVRFIWLGYASPGSCGNSGGQSLWIIIIILHKRAI